MLMMSDFKVGDEVIKVSKSRISYTSSNQPDKEYETQDKMYVISVGRKWIQLGTYPDSTYTEKWRIATDQPRNYLEKDESWNKDKVFRTLDDYEKYKEYHTALKRIQTIRTSSLTMKQLQGILEVCKDALPE